jgi:high-affinity Fe2+/Pb2+ permease
VVVSDEAITPISPCEGCGQVPPIQMAAAVAVGVALGAALFWVVVRVK